MIQVLQVWAIVFAILSITTTTPTERIVFKVLAVICLLIPFIASIAK